MARMGERRDVYRVLVGKTKGKTPLGRPKRTWEDNIKTELKEISGPDSSVSIPTRYGLSGPGIEFWWEARFSARVQTGPGAHPASCTMGTESFTGVKRTGRGADPPPPSSVRRS